MAASSFAERSLRSRVGIIPEAPAVFEALVRMKRPASISSTSTSVRVPTRSRCRRLLGQEGAGTVIVRTEHPRRQ